MTTTTSERSGGGHGSQRLQRETLFIAELLKGATIREAAAASNTPLGTAQRWYRDPDFRKRLTDEQSELVQRSLTRLKAAANTAIDTLVMIARNRGAPPGARVAASGKLLEYTLKSIEISDILSRLETLEQAEERRGRENE
jgi:hypothetical protein